MEGIQVKIEPSDDYTVPFDTVNSPTAMENGGPEFVSVKMEVSEAALEPRVLVKTEADSNHHPMTIKTENATDDVDDVTHSTLPMTNWTQTSGVTVKVEFDYCGNTENQPTTSNFCDQDSTTRWTCDICHENFSNSHNLQQHIVTSHSVAEYQYNVLSKQFSDEDTFDKHTIQHTTSFPCQTCDKTFNTLSNLYRHNKCAHSTDNSHACDICNKTFARKISLIRHQSKTRCKRVADGPILCHVCHKEFKSQYLLKSHLRRHETGKPFNCDVCNVKFKYKSTLSRHMQLHEGIKSIACEQCDKSFTHSTLLKAHLRIHTGEKPYVCAVCNKAFAHKHNMLRHQQGHKKVKHLVCDVCQKRFPKESRLKYHMRTHVNEKYFPCYVCPKRFSHRQNVIKHYSRKHPNMKYEGKDTDASIAMKVWDAVIKSKYEEKPEEILG